MAPAGWGLIGGEGGCECWLRPIVTYDMPPNADGYGPIRTSHIQRIYEASQRYRRSALVDAPGIAVCCDQGIRSKESHRDRNRLDKLSSSKGAQSASPSNTDLLNQSQ